MDGCEVTYPGDEKGKPLEVLRVHYSQSRYSQTKTQAYYPKRAQ